MRNKNSDDIETEIQHLFFATQKQFIEVSPRLQDGKGGNVLVLNYSPHLLCLDFQVMLSNKTQLDS